MEYFLQTLTFSKMPTARLLVHLLIINLRELSAQDHTETCTDSFYQDYGLIHFPLPTPISGSIASECQWNFTVKHGDSILVTFQEFSIDETPNCNQGYVEILERTTNSVQTVLPKTCSSIPVSSTFHSASNSVFIRVYTSNFISSATLLASVRAVSSQTLYTFHREPKRWLEARDLCQENNGELVTVYPVATKEFTDLIEKTNDIEDVWVGQFVTPWVRLAGCVSWSHTLDTQLSYLRSKYNQKSVCSVACSGTAGFLLQGGSCYCIVQHHLLQDDMLPAKSCDIPCPGNTVERCGGARAFTYYQFYEFKIEKDNKFRDCLAETVTSEFEARYCSDKLGFTCGFTNGSSLTYFGKHSLPWQDAVSFCEGLSDSTGLRELPLWPKAQVRALWTSQSRAQHPNYPQDINGPTVIEEAFIASTDIYNQYELKLRDASNKYPFICEHYISDCGGNFTAISGSIKSPGYPGNYPNNQLCEWTIQAPDDFLVRLLFTHFDLEENEICLYDFVQIVETNNMEDIQYCGNLIPKIYLSNGHNVTVRFKSDNSVTGKGFKAYWNSVNRNTLYAESESDASTGQLDGATIAGIIVGTIIVVSGLLLVIFLIYRKRTKRDTSSGLIVTNQIYGLSALSEEITPELGHSYMNVSTGGTRQPDVVEQCYAVPVKENNGSAEGNDVYHYETMAESRQTGDALEICHKTDSEAKLIEQDTDIDAQDDSFDNHITEDTEDENIENNDFDDITLASNLTEDTD